ncbi:MAG: ATP synthase F0 subunit C [Gemmatimonadales bacterium]|jgi:F-type H+-transporting ATPase subunit c|nr:ATP synthase F0 subunit C [Candidatus Palauibacter polyketidifaciens]MXW67584.1 ATP synthase F0 subunit C [Candidatus Palauibacter irciniicola]MXX67495.1 ATP synthase F0 subunit C [Gemmatimonadales bacterium]MYK01163.1 ATP synthase F0 subunit C [Candidatus Palauibacter ramosifaciens]MDE2719890.1 ATP synthase F0 subunit C [Candidatus Palauibacter polyketidifaciens]MYA32701.1 ATP synthase F0 subunit C [Gemmatimonadales bacterium]
MLNMLTLLQGMSTGDGLAIGLAIVGGGLSVLGAGIGIGLIGGRMTEAMARQPEEAQTIQTAAIVLAVFIEGVALFGLVIAGFIRG